jgi:hypothetical protein
MIFLGSIALPLILFQEPMLRLLNLQLQRQRCSMKARAFLDRIKIFFCSKKALSNY